ncbi:MAG TPA: DNA internalization-related competence protein ComEC/Rec2 [Nitrospiraceae bacterium]|nr:DNA internalization-related competence protein ComEC/Rec2 [Nitrospiraceae bacterium]
MLPALTALFAAGLLVGSYLPYFPFLTALLLIALAAVLARTQPRPGAESPNGHRLYAALLGGLLYWHLFAFFMPPFHGLRDADSQSDTLVGTVVEPVQHAPDRAVVVVRLDPAQASTENLPYPTRVRLVWNGPNTSYGRGDRVQFRAPLRPPHGSLNPRGFDYAGYLERQGIDAVATVSGPDAVRLVESGSASLRWKVWHLVDRWRDKIRLAAVGSLPQPALGLFLSLITGERGYLAQEVRDWFMAAGTVHILSISGSHLGLVALVSYGVVRRLLTALPWTWLLALSRRTTPTRIAAMWTMVPVSAYAVLAGAETATVRSLLMVATALLALWLGYRRYLLHALSFAALAILIHDPRALFDISFQLSFLSVWAIAWFMHRDRSEDKSGEVHSWNGWSLRWIREALAISVVVTVATLPLVAFYFNQVPWIGLATNVLVVPFTGALVVPIGLGAALWLIVTGGATLPVAGLIEWLSTVLVVGVRLVAALPAVDVYVAAPTVPMMAFFYWLGVLIMRRDMNGGTRLTAALGMSAVLAWWVWSPRPFEMNGHTFRVTFLDVGQGDSAVVELPDGQVVLIDGGSAYDRFDMGRGVVAPYLWNRGIRTIDHVVASHPQLDHVGGLPSVIDRFTVRHVWTNGLSREELFWKRFEASIEKRGLSMETAGDGLALWSWGSCRMGVLSPETILMHRYAARPVVHAKALNDSSIVIEFSCGAFSLLFTGDLEREGLASVLNRHDVRHVTILKVPHHGAKSSFDRHWLASVRPEVAVFSAGAYNPYRHPAPTVVDAYSEAHALVFRTDRDGAVWADIDLTKSGFQVHRTRDRLLQPVILSRSPLAQELNNVHRLWRRWNWT